MSQLLPQRYYFFHRTTTFYCVFKANVFFVNNLKEKGLPILIFYHFDWN